MEGITEAGATLWALSSDSAEIAVPLRKKLKLTYSLFADSDSKVIDAYRVRNLAMEGKKREGIAIPMTLIINQEGEVVAKLAHESAKVRHSSAELIAELKKLQEE